ncbi:hypothetical protein D3C87_1361520 [compost metagenome]
MHQIVQAVERIITSHVDGLHDHAGFSGMLCPDFVHPPGLDIQDRPGNIGVGILIVHFRDDFAEVNGVEIRVDDQLFVRRSG